MEAMKPAAQIERAYGAAGQASVRNPIISRSRWVMLAFAFVATIINYLDRQTLSVMAPVLLERFRVSATSYSHIIFAFMLAYTVMNGVSGPLLDRLGSKVG